MSMPRQNKIDFPVPVFDGGLNTKYTDVTLPTNMSPDCQNVEFDDFGAVGTTKGPVKITQAVASATIDGLVSYVKGPDERYLMAACNGSMHYYDVNTWTTLASSDGMLTAGADVDATMIRKYVVFTNGVSVPYKYNGNDFERFGVYPLPNATTLSAVTRPTGGAISAGTYNYAITGLNKNNVEGDYFQINSAGIASGVNAQYQLELTGIPVFPVSHGVSEKYLYRTTAAVSSIYYRVTSLFNQVTSYTDNAANSDLVTLAPDDNGPPPKCKYMVYYRGTAFATGNPDRPSRVYISDSGTPETWPSTRVLDINQGDGEENAGFIIYGNSLFVHKNDGRGMGSVWLINMPDSTDVTGMDNWYVEKVNVKYGGVGNKLLVLFQNMQFYMNRFGAYALAGKNLALNPAASEVGQFPVDSISYFIEPNMYAMREDLLDKSASVVFDNKIYVTVPSTKQSMTNDRVLIYDFVTSSGQTGVGGAWSYMTSPSVNNFTIHENDLYAGSALEDGFVYKMFKSRSDDGGAIDSYYWTAQLFGHPEHKDNVKIFRYLYVLVETIGDWDLNVKYVADYKNTSSAGNENNINIKGDGGIWGTGLWGTMKWGNVTVKKLVRVELKGPMVGKSIMFRFRTNTANQWWKVYNLALSYNLRRKRVL